MSCTRRDCRRYKWAWLPEKRIPGSEARNFQQSQAQKLTRRRCVTDQWIETCDSFKHLRAPPWIRFSVRMSVFALCALLALFAKAQSQYPLYPKGVPASFDCAWRELALEYATRIREDSRDKVFDALQLKTLCNASDLARSSSKSDKVFPPSLPLLKKERTSSSIGALETMKTQEPRTSPRKPSRPLCRRLDRQPNRSPSC